MQLIRNGPDVPERLLEIHEDGRLVFFCGAGISFPAGLPSFKELTERLYAEVGRTPDPIQQAALDGGQLDTAIGLLESQVSGGRERVRVALASILTPDFSRPDATATHEALLVLARTRRGRLRLVTTNFDRIFEEVIRTRAMEVEQCQAPMLPPPKNRLDNLIYLHGLLPPAPTAAQLDRLVLSSGDFGLAYLIERWAARFVSELFRNFTVCFVGYSIGDPVLRYMMDALAADKLLGESPPEMFAFGDFSAGDRDRRGNEWKAKNVTPILYETDAGHTLLHGTLREWGEMYRDGVRGKERLIVDYAIARPVGSTVEDDFVGRVLWALQDLEGLPAKRFAEIDPVPSLDWLTSLSEDRYGFRDLGRFGVGVKGPADSKLRFSLTRRPSAYNLSPPMCISDTGASGRWDEVMFQLCRWLVRHLNDPRLFTWLVKQGAVVHEQFRSMVRREMERIEDLEVSGNIAEIERIRASAPNAIPSERMRKLWHLYLDGRIKRQ